MIKIPLETGGGIIIQKQKFYPHIGWKSVEGYHVISPTPSEVNTAFSVVLPYEASHYDSLGIPGGELQINEDIWESIKSQGLTDWRAFDRWKYNSGDGYFYFTPLGEGDGYVDIIYKIHKSRSAVMYDARGFNALSGHALNDSFVVDDTNNIVIKYGTGDEGSGVTISFTGQLAQYLGTTGHEHGHYLFSPAHSTYSRVSFGMGCDDFYSPADMILNQYMTPSNVTFNTINTLGDYSSRNSGTGEILKVPIEGSEYFLLINRNKVSKWDRVMIGDSAQVNPYGDSSNYGKGLYIYHIENGINLPNSDISQLDMECADGFFEWEYAGLATNQETFNCYVTAPDWPYFKKKNVLYNNDPSTLFNSNPYGDGISFHHFYNGKARSKWWGDGKKPGHNCDIGIDRLHTHDNEIYARFDSGGDRYDPWKPGYNEVFSPYSSPNTKTWSNENSGIFIWYYEDLSSPPNTARMKIYKVGESGLSQDSILKWTPPTRPMGLEVVECDSQPTINGFKRIKLTWNHNMEPDMLGLPSNGLKKYKIYRNTGIYMTDALQYSENYYSLLATVYIDENNLPSYIDSTVVSGCNEPPREAPPYWVSYPIRYRVQAVDRYSTSSVLSDFASTTGWIFGEGGEEEQGDNRPIAENAPKEYSLKQNYPNPFNPSTKIKYELPYEGNVAIKIYDITGRIIMTLVNENKTAGRYEVIFNGENFASGIYYFKIESGNFSQVRKMILIK